MGSGKMCRAETALDDNKKAPPEGMGGAVGLWPGPLTLEGTGHHERRRCYQYPAPQLGSQTLNGKCCHAESRAMNGKKRGSNRSWSLMIGPKPNRKFWPCAREEDKRLTGLTKTEGGGFGFNPGVGNAGPREEVTERRRSDKANIGFDRLVSNA